MTFKLLIFNVLCCKNGLFLEIADFYEILICSYT